MVLDPRNGEVLAFTSRPAYDPNAFAAGIDRATWSALNTDELKPLQNRALQGRYSPGSTFKMAVGLAGLEEGIITPDFHVLLRRRRRPSTAAISSATRRTGHGTVDLRQAIEQSCDVYFYTVGNMLGVDRINKWATLFGLGVKSNIDLPNEVTGLVPSTAWKATTREQKWYAGETISVAIGQGQVSVTPISLAVYAATLANGGTRVTPHLAQGGRRRDAAGSRCPPPPPQSVVEVTPEKLQAIRDGMWMRRQRRRRHRRAARASKARTSAARPARRRSSRTRDARAGKDDEEPARPRLVRVLRAARQPGDRRRGLRSSTASTARTPRSIAQPHPRDLLREEGRPAAAAAADAPSRCASIYSDPYARRRRAASAGN